MSSILRFRLNGDPTLADADATAALADLDIVWLKTPRTLRSIPEMGWVSEVGAANATVGPARPLPYDVSTYGTTVYVICTGAFVGETLLDVNTKSYFIGDTAIEMVFVKLFAMGFSLEENAGLVGTIKAIRSFVRDISAKDRDELSIEIHHLSHTDSSDAQNSYMDLLTFAGDFGVGTVGCSAESLGTFEYAFMDRAKGSARARGKPYATAVAQVAALFSEDSVVPSERQLREAAETHALQVAQGFRVTSWETGMHSVSKHGAIRLLDLKEMVGYSADPAGGVQYFKKRATAFVSCLPGLSAGLAGLTNPSSLMRVLTELAEAFEISTPIPHLAVERIAAEVAKLATSVAKRKEGEHAEEWASRVCKHKAELQSSGKSLEHRRLDSDASSSKASSGTRAKEFAQVWASDEYERTTALLIRLRSEEATLEQLAEVALTCKVPPEMYPAPEEKAKREKLLNEERDAAPITLLLQAMLNSSVDPRTATPTVPFLAELRDRDILGRVLAKRATRSLMQVGPEGTIPAALRTLCLRDLLDQILDFDGKIDWVQTMVAPILAAFNAAKSPPNQ